MSDVSQGPGWWMASDGKWYPPESAPGYQQQGQQFGQVPGTMPNYPTGPATTYIQVPHDALGRPYADWWYRAGATLIDILLIGAIQSVVFLAAHSRSGVVAYVLFPLSFLYQALMIANKGGTLGNMAVGTVVVDANSGAPASQAQSWKRAAMETAFSVGGAMLLGIPTLLDILWPLWDQQNQTLHDKVAGTVVVKRR